MATTQRQKGYIGLRLFVAFALLGVGLFVVRGQSLRPEPLREPTWWEWLRYPQETNAFLRVPVVSSRLNDVSHVPGTKELWIVGDRGVVLHSRDDGATWERVEWPPKEVTPAEPAPQPRAQSPWHRLDFALVSEAHAAEKAELPLVSEQPQPEQPRETPVHQETAPPSPEDKRGEQAVSPSGGRQQTPAQSAAPPAKAASPTTPPPRENTAGTESPALGKPGAPTLTIEQTSPTNPAQGTASTESNGPSKTPEPTVTPPPRSNATRTQLRAVPAAAPATPEPPNLSIVRFVDSLRGVVIANNGALWRTFDGGNRWIRFEYDYDSGPIAPLALSHEGELVWVGGGNGLWEAELFAADSKPTWRQVFESDSPVTGAALLGGGRGRFVSAGQTLFEARGDGRSPAPLTGPSPFTTVGIAEDATAWAAGKDQIFVLRRDSAEWEARPPAVPMLSLGFLAAYPVSDTSTCFGDMNGLHCTSDSGGTWNDLPNPDPGHRRRLSTRDGDAWLLADGASRWTRDRSEWTPMFSSPGLVSAQLVDGSVGFAVFAHTLLKSTDAGRSFRMVTDSATAMPLEVEFSDSLRGVATLMDRRPMFSRDGGLTWQRVAPGGVNPIFPDCNSQGICMAARGGSRVVSSDGGETWSKMNSLPSLDGDGDIALSPGKKPRAWQIQRTGSVWESKDLGGSWNETTISLPSGASYLPDVALIDNDTAWAAGASLWHSTDSGLHWEVVAIRHPGPFTRVSFANAKLGMVAAADGTLLRTEDGGAKWTPLKHGRGAAPWFYFLCFSSLVLVLPWSFGQKRDENIAAVLASDRPLRAYDRDSLGFGTVAEGLADFMKNSRTEPPLTLAVTGEWGSGKSSLMNLLKEKLEDAGFRPVWFNAWHHQKGEHLLASLYANIQQQAVPPWISLAGLRYRGQLVLERVLEHWFATSVVALLVTFFVAWASHDWSRPESLLKGVIDPLLSGPKVDPGDFAVALVKALGLATAPGISVLLPTWRALRAFGLDPAKLKNSLPGESQSDSQGEPGARYRFAAEFKQFTHSLRPRTLVLFIDDLDRCSKEHVVEVLETVNFLVVSGDCFVVLGMAERWVERCVQLAFKDLAPGRVSDQPDADEAVDFAKQYLEKLINIRVPIRKPTDDESRAMLKAMSDVTTKIPKPPLGKRAKTTALRWLPAAAIVAVTLGTWFWGHPLTKEFKVTSETRSPMIENRGQLVFSKPGEKGGEQVELTFPVHAPANGNASAALTQGQVVGEIPLGDRKTAQVILEQDAKNAKDRTTLFGPFKVGGQELSVVLPPVSAGGSTPPVAKLPNPTDPNAPPVTRDILMIPKVDLGGDFFWKLALAVAAGFLVALIFTWVASDPAVVYDAPKFGKALDAWLPWIVAKRETPRALKRFINNVRYVAMRERAELKANQQKTGVAQPFDEGVVVALASLHHLDKDLVVDPGAFTAACSGNAAEALKAVPPDLAKILKTIPEIGSPESKSLLPDARTRFLRIMAELEPTAD